MVIFRVFLIFMFNDKSLAENWTNLAENMIKVSSAELGELAFCNSGYDTILVLHVFNFFAFLEASYCEQA